CACRRSCRGPRTYAGTFQGSQGGLEAFVFAQVAPLSQRQVAELDVADAHALEADHFQTDQFAHAADLTLAAFLEYEVQLVVIDPADLGGAQLDAIETEAVIEQADTFSRKLTFDTDQIFLFHVGVFADQLPCDDAVLGQYQQAGGVDIETTRRRQTAQIGGVKHLRPRFALLRLRLDQRGGRLVAVLGLTGDEANRLVQDDGDARLLLCLGQRVQRDRGGRIDLGAEFGDAFAIDEDQAALDIAVGLAARAQAAFGHEFGDAHHAFALGDWRGGGSLALRTGAVIAAVVA